MKGYRKKRIYEIIQQEKVKKKSRKTGWGNGKYSALKVRKYMPNDTEKGKEISGRN